MSGERSSGSAVPWPAVATAVAVVGGLFLYWTPLKSSRPQSPPGRPMRSLGAQDVDARLWQDPLSVADAHQAELAWYAEKKQVDPIETQLHALSTIRSAIRERVRASRERDSDRKDNDRSSARAEDRASPLLVLPVMVVGGAHADLAERR